MKLVYNCQSDYQSDGNYNIKCQKCYRKEMFEIKLIIKLLDLFTFE